MTGEEPTYWITPTLGATTMPVEQILTGRGAILGKSGSGKSNTTSVIIEQLIESGYTLLIVDPEGEYVGLKEKYDILHAGKGADCDVSPSLDDVSDIVQAALYENTPVVLDVSDYLDGDFADSLVGDTLTELFQQENEAQKPFLTVVEEIQEYLPQSGGTDEVSEIIERIAKRGRKRGLGLLGISQRPSSVDKDFVTQCDWMVWHRLTWKNDITVVRDILGSEYANKIEHLETGEAFLMTDWDEDVDRVKFRRKSTRDAGATPGLEQYENVPTAGEGGTGPSEEGGAESGEAADSGDQPSTADSADESGEDTTTASGAGGPASVSQPGTDEPPTTTNPESPGMAEAAEDIDAVGALDAAGDPDATGEANASDQPAASDPPNATDRAGSTDPSGPNDQPTSAEQPQAYGVGRSDATVPTLASSIPPVETELDVPVTTEQLDTIPRAQIAEDINAIHAQNTDLRDRLETMSARLRETEEYADFSVDGDGEDFDESGQTERPSPPEPPAPPKPRTGVAGSLVEFSLLLVYMLKLIAFRLRYSGRRVKP